MNNLNLTIPIMLVATVCFSALWDANTKLKNENETLKALQMDYKKQIEKLSDFSDKKQALNEDLQTIKATFKEQEDEKINDNLLDAIDFINARLCSKGS